MTEPPETGPSPVTPIRVAIADDNATMRATLDRVLSTSPVFEIAFTAEDPEALTGELTANAVDVLVLDLRFGDAWGLDLLPRIRALPDAPVVVVYSAIANPAVAAEVGQAGVFRLIEKGAPLEELRRAITDAARSRSAC
ncbi:MAG: response regulator transcription factor [Acidimicrobiales bacterium]